jgi:hypothetical protein
MVAFALTIFPINEAAALPLADSAEGTSAISEGILGKEADATRSMGVQNESRTVIGITVIWGFPTEFRGGLRPPARVW